MSEGNEQCPEKRTTMSETRRLDVEEPNNVWRSQEKKLEQQVLWDKTSDINIDKAEIWAAKDLKQQPPLNRWIWQIGVVCIPDNANIISSHTCRIAVVRLLR
jgi:hypothetical protein